MSREEDELIGSKPVPGEDPRFDGGDGVFVEDNGAFAEIEDRDQFDSVDVDDDPFMPGIVDNDGSPGFRPFVDASKTFEQEAGLETVDEEASDDEILGDEFAERVQQRQEASTDVAGRPVSDLAQLAQVSHIRHKQETRRAPYVRINPESASNGLSGSQVQLRTNSDGPKEVAVWSANSDVETTAVTCTFVPLPIIQRTIESVSPFGVFRPFGIINFGTRVRYQAEVDIGTGVQFTVNASEVSLQVAFDPSANTTDQDTMFLGGMLSFLPCVRTAPLVRTRYIDNLLAGTTSDSILIPPFSRNVIFWRNATAAVTVTFLNEIGTIYSFSIAAGAVMTVPVAIPGDARFFTVQNTDAVPVTHGRLIFELGL